MEMYGRQLVPVVPYHVTAQVEDNTSSEFLLLQPLTPQARPNLNAWLAARIYTFSADSMEKSGLTIFILWTSVVSKRTR